MSRKEEESYFYPRSPCGERRLARAFFLCALEFLSTLSLRRATGMNNYIKTYRKISIHALLAESDLGRGEAGSRILNFYPRSPCGERHLMNRRRKALILYFYPRSPCGERLLGALWVLSIQIFLSTLSLRRATSTSL